MMENPIIKIDIKEFVDHFPLYEQFRDKTILITGITGLIGSISAKCIIALDEKYKLNCKIIGIVRDINIALSLLGNLKQIEFISINLNDINDIKYSVDYILHFACPTSSRYFIEHPIEVYDIICKGTEKILQYAVRCNIKSMVYASSIESYGSNDTMLPITEDFQGYIDPLSTRSSYSLGKRSAEFLSYSYFKEFNLPVKIARLTQTFGAGANINDSRVFAQFAKSAILQQDIILHSTGKSSKPYIYTTDAVSAILFILLKGNNGEAYNIANSNSFMSIKAMADLIKSNFSPNINIRIEIDKNKGYAPDTILNLDVSKLFRLGWSPRISIIEMYQRLIQYYQTYEI